MAIGQDVLATALQEHMPGVFEQWTTWHPVWDQILNKGGWERLKGPYRVFSVVTGPPGKVDQINDGSQTMTGVRKQTGVFGREYGTRLIYHFDVPLKDLDECSGPNDLARILKNYPEAGMSDFAERLSAQFVMGNGEEVGGFFTLNSDTTYDPDGTAVDGGLEFVAPASQSKTVHNIAATSSNGWTNQYGHISSMANDGLKTLRRALGDANYQGQTLGKCDIGLADVDSYYNYIDVLTDPVRITYGEAKKGVGDPAPDQGRDGVMLDGLKLFPERFIIPASFSTSAAQNGVIYLLNTNMIEMFSIGDNGETGGVKQTNKGNFRMRGPFRIPDADAVRTEIVFHANCHLTSRRHHAVVTGGAQV